MRLPDRIRLSPYARLTVLKAIKVYIESLLLVEKEKQNWPEAQTAYKIAKSLALRLQGRRKLWSDDFYFDADSGKPLKEIQSWIDELEAHYKLQITVAVAPTSSQET